MSSLRTDDDLVAIVDQFSGWIIRAGEGGERILANPGTLRTALAAARRQNTMGDGEPVYDILRHAPDGIIIDTAQINRLWERLGI